MTLNCLIIDDEPVARKVLEDYIEDVPFLQLVGKAENPLKAKPVFDAHEVHLLFLDINMPGMNGLDFLRSANRLPPCILTTAYSEYAAEGFALDVMDYLVKPFSAERFLKACTKAKEYCERTLQPAQTALQKPDEDFFFVKCDGKIEKVFFDELFYVEAMQNYVVLHTEHKKMMVYLSLKSVEEQLPESLFLKIHKSTIVNLKKVRTIENNQLDLGKARVTISQNLQDAVLKKIISNKLIKR